MLMQYTDNYRTEKNKQAFITMVSDQLERLQEARRFNKTVNPLSTAFINSAIADNSQLVGMADDMVWEADMNNQAKHMKAKEKPMKAKKKPMKKVKKAMKKDKNKNMKRAKKVTKKKVMKVIKKAMKVKRRK